MINERMGLRVKRAWLETMLKLRVSKKALKYATGGLGDADLIPTGRLEIQVRHRDGRVEEHGLVSTKMVDTSGVNYIAALLASGAANTMYYHASGTGTVAPAITDTALGTEVGTRATGTHTASGNVYTSVGVVNYTGTYAITEMGIFSASTAGTLLDRFTFAALNVISGDTITFTFTLTLPAGG